MYYIISYIFSYHSISCYITLSIFDLQFAVSLEQRYLITIIIVIIIATMWWVWGQRNLRHLDRKDFQIRLQPYHMQLISANHLISLTFMRRILRTTSKWYRWKRPKLQWIIYSYSKFLFFSKFCFHCNWTCLFAGLALSALQYLITSVCQGFGQLNANYSPPIFVPLTLYLHSYSQPYLPLSCARSMSSLEMLTPSKLSDKINLFRFLGRWRKTAASTMACSNHQIKDVFSFTLWFLYLVAWLVGCLVVWSVGCLVAWSRSVSWL